MTNKMKLVWRLGKLPTPIEVTELLKDKIITQDEAREILFSSESKEDRDVKSLESEIKFLRELVDKLSQAKSDIVKYIEVIKPVYIREPWYQPYQMWCGTITTNLTDCNSTWPGNTNFTSIQTW